MGTRDPRVDAYIERAAPFARPVLTHLREVVHAACPDAEETLKWGMPTFMHHGILCSMAAFKQHCTFAFWKGALVVGGDAAETGMGQFGRITAVADLPPRKVLTGYVTTAMRLNEEGAKHPTRAKAGTKPELPVPDDLAAALRTNAPARATFETFPPSKRRDYVEWITEAKTAATRERRLATTLEWLAEGKARHWKYEKG